MGATVWRSARSQGGCGRLGRTYSVCRNAKLRPARHGEFARLSSPFRRRPPRDVEARQASRDCGRGQRRSAFAELGSIFRLKSDYSPLVRSRTPEGGGNFLASSRYALTKANSVPLAAAGATQT